MVVEYIISLCTWFLLYSCLCLGMNLVYGYTGIINFAHVVPYAVGAYSSALLTIAGYHPVIGLLTGIAISICISIVLGFITLRVKKSYFALFSLILAMLTYSFLRNEVWLTGGPFGLPDIPPFLSGVFTGPQKAYSWFLLLSFYTLVAYLFLNRLVDCPLGRVLKGIREDEAVCSGLGKNVLKFKVLSLTIASSLASITGSLFAHFMTFISPDVASFDLLFMILGMTLLGGVGSNKGSIVGAFVWAGLSESTRFLKDIIPFLTASHIGSIRLIIMGTIIVLLSLFRPEGIIKEKKKVYK